MRRDKWVAGLRRLFGFAAGTTVVVAVLSLIAGLLLGSDPRRSISVGLYGVGSLYVVVGIFYGVRPPVRTTGGGGSPGIFGSLAAGGGSARWADREDIEESLGLSAVFVSIGLLLIVIGAAIDPRVRLV
jgi:uncharacterized membrane protein HdeD (DUF308 family)